MAGLSNLDKCPWCPREWHGLPEGHCQGSHTAPLVACPLCWLTTPHTHPFWDWRTW